MNMDKNSQACKRRRIVRQSIEDANQLALCPPEVSQRYNAPLQAARSGCIRRIILRNIFCHEYLDFDALTDKINLFQGANGSGKSSIVAAIIAGLGGTSKATDRAKNLKSFITVGKQSASIEIYLNNEGYLAYKYADFGNQIIVERKISSSGASSYKIKAYNGAVISNKKEELNKILLWFNLQVENPALILSQERAKTFLSTSTPKLLFDFYFNATSLREFSDSVDHLSSDINSIDSCIKGKEESLRCIKMEVKEWKSKVDAVRNIGNKKEKLIYLRKARAWAEVLEIEREEKKIQEKMAGIERNRKEINSKIKDLEEFIEKNSKGISDEDQTLANLLSEAREIEASRERVAAELSEAKISLAKSQQRATCLRQERSGKEEDVRNLREKLNKEEPSRNLHADWKVKMEEVRHSKESLREKMASLDKYLSLSKTHYQNVAATLEQTRRSRDQFIAEQNSLANRLRNMTTEQKNLQERRDNVSIFGTKTAQILQEINDMSQRNLFRMKPIGPIGLYIKSKDKKWTHIVEFLLKRHLFSFVCFTREDTRQLGSLFSRIFRPNETKPDIIQVEFRQKVHDVRRFETRAPGYFNLWSVIDVGDVQVANIIIDYVQPESILLVPTAEQANDLLIDSQRVPPNCLKAVTLNGDTYFPDPNFKVYSGSGDPTTRYLQVSVEERMRDLKASVDRANLELKEVRGDFAKCNQEHERVQNEEAKSTKKIADMEKNLNEYKRQMNNLNAKEMELQRDEPVVVDENEARKGLLIDLEEAEELASAMEQKMKENVEDIKKMKDLVEKKKGEHSKISIKINKIQESIQNIQEEKKNIDSVIAQKQKLTKAYVAKKTELTASLEEHSEARRVVKSNLSEKTESAANAAPERIKTDKSPKELERSYLALEKVIQEEESNFGDLDELVCGLRIRQEKCDSIVDEVKTDRSFLHKLRISLEERQKNFRLSKKIMENLFKNSFMNCIRKRNLEARVTFNYNNRSLTIEMKKSTGQDNSQMQSLSMMSGGERSFATVSFILALWDWISSPIRIMDEFDIFMDVVSRSQCMDLIITTAKPTIQYILISPLEYNKNSKKLSIFRLSAPKRKRSQEDYLED